MMWGTLPSRSRRGPGLWPPSSTTTVGGDLLLPPWGYQRQNPSPPDFNYQTDLTDAMVAAIFKSSGKTFQAGANLFPNDPGTAPDWAYGALGIRASMTLELEAGGAAPFCLSKSRIQAVGKEQYDAFLAAVAYISTAGNLQPSAEIGTLRREIWASLPLSGRTTTTGSEGGRITPPTSLTTTTTSQEGGVKDSRSSSAVAETPPSAASTRDYDDKDGTVTRAVNRGSARWRIWISVPGFFPTTTKALTDPRLFFGLLRISFT